jgi:TolA-binding protein
MKEEFNKDIGNIRKKNQTETLEIKVSLNQIKNTGETPASTLEQAENRISGLEDKIDINEKNKRTLRQNTQKLEKEYARTQQLHQRTKPANHGQ